MTREDGTMPAEYIGALENENLVFKIAYEDRRYTYSLYDKLNGTPMADFYKPRWGFTVR